MNRTVIVAAIAGLSLLPWSNVVGAAPYNAVRDFHSTTNSTATSPWTYGYAPGGLQSYAFVPFTGHPSKLSAGLTGWIDPALGEASSPSAVKNGTTTEIDGVHAGAFALNPNDGRGIAAATLRFTVPTGGCFAIQGTFYATGNSSGSYIVPVGQPAAVVRNGNAGAPIWAAASTDSSPRFQLAALKLEAGETLDFVVGSAPGGVAFNTPLDVAVTPVGCADGAASTHFDAAGDFQVANNPGGVWSYGYSPAGDYRYSFVPFDSHPVGVSSDFAVWNKQGYVVSGTPAAWKYLGNGLAFGIAKNELSLHPGPTPFGDLAIVRFSAPWSGCYTVTGRFGAGDSGVMSASVVQAGVFAKPLWSVADTNGSGPFALGALYLRVGETLDFIVGNNGNYGSGNTPLDAKIASVRCAMPASTLAFDAAANFRVDANDGAPWLFGFSPSGGSGYQVVPFDVHPASSSFATPVWAKAGYQVSGTPAAWKNNTAVSMFGVTKEQLSVHPGPTPNGDYAVVRFTAPVAGQYRVKGRFFAGDSGDMNARIVTNGAFDAGLRQAFDSTNASPTFDLGSIHLDPSLPLDFIVGNKGVFYSGNTPVDAFVVPELPAVSGEERCDRGGWPQVTTLSADVAAIAQRPGRSRIAFAPVPANPVDGLLLLVDDAPGLPDDEVLVELDLDPANGVHWTKSIEARGFCHGSVVSSLATWFGAPPPPADGSYPPPPPPLVDANDLRSGMTMAWPSLMRLKRNSARELWLRKPGFLGFWYDLGMIDSSFWSAFGGRRVRFIWRFD